jgi:circadian clock protein KaiB
MELMSAKNPVKSKTTSKFEKLATDQTDAEYVLRLYVAGNTSRSAQAIINIREICESRLKGRYKLEVIDIYQQSGLAKGEQIIAVPTLIKSLPLPLKRIIGDMTKTEQLIFGLDLRKSNETLQPKPDKPV